MFDPLVDGSVIGVIGVIIGAFLVYLFGSYQESKQKNIHKPKRGMNPTYSEK